MDIFSNPICNFLFETFFGEIFLTIIGVALAQPLINWFNNQRYGKWHLTVIKKGENRIEHMPISPQKMKQVLEIPEEMPVFLKGMCSPFHHINCDLMKQGKELGVLNVDEINRKILINLDKDTKNIRVPEYFISQKVDVAEILNPDNKTQVLKIKTNGNIEEQITPSNIYLSKEVVLIKKEQNIDTYKFQRQDHKDPSSEVEIY